MAIVIAAVGIFFLHPPSKPPTESDALERVELIGSLIGGGSKVTLVNFIITKAGGTTQQKQLIIFSQRVRGQLGKRIIAVAEPEGERLLALEGKLFFFLPSRGEVEELTDNESRSRGFADSTISREEMGLGFQLSRRYEAREAGKAQLEDKEATIWQLSLKAGEGSNYPTAKLFVDKGTRMPLRLEFFSEDGKLHRVVEWSELVQFEGEWLANRVRVKELLDGKSTEVWVLSRKSQPLFDLLFAPDQLKGLQFDLPKK